MRNLEIVDPEFLKNSKYPFLKIILIIQANININIEQENKIIIDKIKPSPKCLL